MAITLPHDAMASVFRATLANDLPVVPNYNVCPTTQIATVTSDAGVRHLRAMRWGFVPHWYTSPTDGPLLINARAETIAQKPAFRAACRDRRCLIVAAGFYEWKRVARETPLPFWVTRQDKAPMVFAGIWQDWTGADPQATCAIVTTQANDDMAPIHHRLPVILDADDWPLWLGEAGKGAATLMRPVANGALVFEPVSTAVNSNKSSGAALIVPVDRPM